MGRRRTIPVTTVGQFWDALMADYGAAGTYALAVEDIITAIESGVYGLSALNDDIDALLAGVIAGRLNFYDEFNRTVEDTDVWTSGGDGGEFVPIISAGFPTSWWLKTGNANDNDWYIHGDAVTENIRATPYEDGYTTVTWEARLSLNQIVNMSSFMGLIENVIIDYAEPAANCAYFLVDPVITNTFRARSYLAAEEETDTLIALDTEFHKFKIVWTQASVLFYIDDVLVATHAVRVPDTPMTTEFLIRTETNAAAYLFLDYVHMEVT